MTVPKLKRDTATDQASQKKNAKDRVQIPKVRPEVINATNPRAFLEKIGVFVPEARSNASTGAASTNTNKKSAINKVTEESHNATSNDDPFPSNQPLKKRRVDDSEDINMRNAMDTSTTSKNAVKADKSKKRERESTKGAESPKLFTTSIKDQLIETLQQTQFEAEYSISLDYRMMLNYKFVMSYVQI